MARVVLDSDPNYHLILCMHTPPWSQRLAACVIPCDLTANRNSILITNSKLPYNYITYANPGAERTKGYRLGETVGKNCRLLWGRGWGLRRREQTKE